MDIRSRKDALSILLLNEDANDDDIKASYRELLKKYHPDQNPGADKREEYDSVIAAYSYVSSHPKEYENYVKPVQKIIGDSSPARNNALRAQEIRLQERRKERARKKESDEKREAAEKKRRKKAHDEAVKKFFEEARRKEEEYNDAMEKIAAIRTARAIEAALDAFRDRENGEETGY